MYVSETVSTLVSVQVRARESTGACQTCICDTHHSAAFQVAPNCHTDTTRKGSPLWFYCRTRHLRQIASLLCWQRGRGAKISKSDGGVGGMGQGGGKSGGRMINLSLQIALHRCRGPSLGAASSRAGARLLESRSVPAADPFLLGPELAAEYHIPPVVCNLSIILPCLALWNRFDSKRDAITSVRYCNNHIARTTSVVHNLR